MARPRKNADDTLEKLALVKVRPETKRLLRLIAVAERVAEPDLLDEMARERWDRVKQSNLLP